VIGKYFIDIARKEDAYRSVKAFKQVRDRSRPSSRRREFSSIGTARNGTSA
jgi:hypothetical protein